MKKRTFSLHFTSLHFTRLGLLMLSLLAFASCQKEEKTTVVSKAQPSAMAIEGDIVAEGGSAVSCNCEYQIVEVNNSTPPVGQNFQFLVSSPPTEICITNVNCTYFAFLEAETDCVPYFSQSPGCFDLESPGSMKPTAWYPFNCQIPGYSTISPAVRQEGFWKPNCLFQGGGPTGNIKIRIRCTDSPAMTCGHELGKTHYSDILVLPIDETSENGVPRTLGGCGCQFMLQ